MTPFRASDRPLHFFISASTNLATRWMPIEGPFGGCGVPLLSHACDLDSARWSRSDGVRSRACSSFEPRFLNAFKRLARNSIRLEDEGLGQRLG